MPPEGGIFCLATLPSNLRLAGTARIQEPLAGESRQAARLVEGPPERPSESRLPILKQWAIMCTPQRCGFLRNYSMTGVPATQHSAALPAHASAFVLGSLLLDHLHCAPNTVRGDADDLLKALDRWLLSHCPSDE